MNEQTLSPEQPSNEIEDNKEDKEAQGLLLAREIAALRKTATTDYDVILEMTEKLMRLYELKLSEIKEAEVKSNLEFWQELGIEVNEVDIRKKIRKIPEVEGFDHYIYVPKGIKLSELWEKMKEKQPVYDFSMSLASMDAIENINPDTRDNKDDSYAIAVKFQPEPDADTLGDNAKSAEEWNKLGDTFISPIEYLITAMRYHAETGKHLDESTYTICPGSRFFFDSAPGLFFDPGSGGIGLFDDYPTYRYPSAGVRRVITSSQK